MHGIPAERVATEIMLIEPSEVAELVVYLCSGAVESVNGSSFVIDGRLDGPLAATGG